LETSVLYLYGICDEGPPPEPMPAGLESRAADIVPHDGFAAVTTDLQSGRPPATGTHIREHFRVIEAFMASHTILPARFGTTFTELAELKAHLELEHGAYASDLRRLRGQIELGVKAAWRTAPERISDFSAAFTPRGYGPGTSYLAAKHAEATRRDVRHRLAQDLADMLTPVVSHATQAMWRILPAVSDKVEISLAALLLKERLGAFRESLAMLRLTEPNLDILCTGPWPPYSFVNAPSSQAMFLRKSQEAFRCRA
jgi:hypothetical protein